MQTELFDILVIGSGPTGVHAAIPLMRAGFSVGMLDAGTSRAEAFENAATSNFEDVRRHDHEQHKIFLGENFSGIPVGGIRGGQSGGMLSANRSYVLEGADEFLPIISPDVHIVQSLAKGGLAESWGAVCDFLNEAEAAAVGIPYAELVTHYRAVAHDIGVSGPAGTPYPVQSAAIPDHHAKKILEIYNKKIGTFEKLGLRVQQPYLAMATYDMPGRKAVTYHDMEFWADPHRSIYRPRYTLDDMIARNEITYIAGYVVQRAEECADGMVHVHAKTFTRGEKYTTTFRAKKIVLACGAINTARVLLRSKNMFGVTTPMFTKSHWYVPCLHPRMIGVAGDRMRHSLCQLVIQDGRHDDHRARGDIFCQLYSYKSLMLFRLLGFSPFGVFDSLRLFADWSPALMIADIRLSKWASATTQMELVRTGDADVLHIRPASVNTQTHAEDAHHLKHVLRGLRALGLMPLKQLPQPEGSASHYVGTIPPVGTMPSAPLHTESSGRLAGSRGIYIADASTWCAIPAKPLTLTMMANARRIGAALAAEF